MKLKYQFAAEQIAFIVNFHKFPHLKLPIIQTRLNINNDNKKRPAGGACLSTAASSCNNNRQLCVHNSAKLCNFFFFYVNFMAESLLRFNVSQRWLISLYVSFAGQYHLQIEKAQLEDDAPFECQAGQSESSGAIISNTAWVNVLSELNSGKRV